MPPSTHHSQGKEETRLAVRLLTCTLLMIVTFLLLQLPEQLAPPTFIQVEKALKEDDQISVFKTE